MTNLGAFAIEHAPWLMLGVLALFVARLLGNIQRSENEEHARQSAVAEGRIVGFLEPDGRMTSEPSLYPNGDRDRGTLVVYEFQPDSQSATIRGQDGLQQHDLERVRVGTRVRVRFNPKLPAHSRLDNRDTQGFAELTVPSAIPPAIEQASTKLAWTAVAFIGLGFFSMMFPSATFVPSTGSVNIAYLVATGCAVWIFLISRRVPARLPETTSSRFVTLWLRPAVYALLTFYYLPAFLGHLLPAAVTRLAGTEGERAVTVSGYKSVFRRDEATDRRQWRCGKTEFKGVPTRLVGDDVLCADWGDFRPAGTVVSLRGRVSPFGILVDEASW